MTNYLEKYKPVDVFLLTIKGKYKIPILIYLKQGTKRYNHIRRKFSGASERILIKQLKELEASEIIKKSITGTKAPFRSEYALSDYGKSLCRIISDMWMWGETHLKHKPATPRLEER